MNNLNISQGRLSVAMILTVLVVVMGVVGVAYYFYSRTPKVIKTTDGTTVNYEKDGDEIRLKAEDGSEMVGGKNIKLPSSFPKNLPVYPNITLVVATTEDDMAMYQGTTKDTPQTVLSWYRKELEKSGWTYSMSDTISVVYTNPTHTVQVNVLETDGEYNIQLSTIGKDTLGL